MSQSPRECLSSKSTVLHYTVPPDSTSSIRQGPSLFIAMHFSKLGAASALVAFTSATPVDYEPLEKRGVAFKLHQSIPKPFMLSGPSAVLSTYRKYKATAPADVVSAAANNDGTVTASPEQYDSEYLCPVTIGGQTLNLDFDTGSSDL